MAMAIVSARLALHVNSCFIENRSICICLSVKRVDRSSSFNILQSPGPEFSALIWPWVPLDELLEDNARLPSRSVSIHHILQLKISDEHYKHIPCSNIGD